MGNDLYVRRNPALNRASDSGMTAYESVVAKEQMDDAMLLAHRVLRAVAHTQAAVSKVGRTLKGLLAPQRPPGTRGMLLRPDRWAS
jgi:hypothetical protein